MLALLVAANRGRRLSPGREGAAVALDPAANAFHREGAYRIAGDVLDSAALVERYADMVACRSGASRTAWPRANGTARAPWPGSPALP